MRYKIEKWFILSVVIIVSCLIIVTHSFDCFKKSLKWLLPPPINILFVISWLPFHKLTSFYTNSVHFIGQILLSHQHYIKLVLAVLNNYNYSIKSLIYSCQSTFFHLAIFLLLFWFLSLTASNSFTPRNQ